MPQGRLLPKAWTNPRYSFTAVAMVGLAIFGLAIVLVSEVLDHRGQRYLIDQNLRIRLGGIATVFEAQSELAGGDLELRHRLAETYAAGPGIIWAQIVATGRIQHQVDHPPVRQPSNLTIDDDLIAEIVQDLEQSSGQHSTLRDVGRATLVACLLSDGHALLVLFDRDQIAAQIDLPQKSLWIALTFMIAVAALILYFSSRYMLHKPIQQLTKALEKADESFELHFEKPLPRNEIGFLGHKIDQWLKKLRQTQSDLERMALVSQSTSNAILIIGPDREVTWVNNAFTTMTGYSPEETLGNKPGHLLNGPETSPEKIAEVEANIAAGRSYTVEAKVRRKDGSHFWASAEGQAICDTDGALAGWIMMIADITERKTAEEEISKRVHELESARETQAQLANELRTAKKTAERSNASKSEFLANMSHEIRTPMNGVLGMADVLLTTDLDDDQRDYVQTIKDSGVGLLTILNDILDLSKLESGKITLNKTETNLERVLGSVKELMQPRASERNVSIIVDIPDDVPANIFEDSGRLRQVLLNLVGNAVKFTPEGTITMSARLTRGTGKAQYLRLEIKDTGVGISEEFQQKLFERFEQGDVVAARSAGGTGLGLSICRELIWLMGGEIGLQSEKGKGSTFWIEIPFLSISPKAAETAHQSDSANKRASEPDTSNRLNLLLAEDHEVNQSLMKAFIAKLGHDLTIAPDGVEAVKAVRGGDFDLVLMDIQMPRMDGVMATKVIRSLETGPSDIPIIAVTANAMAGQREHYIASGMNGYVSKPVQLQELETEIQRVWKEYCESRDGLRRTA